MCISVVVVVCSHHIVVNLGWVLPRPLRTETSLETMSSGEGSCESSHCCKTSWRPVSATRRMDVLDVSIHLPIYLSMHLSLSASSQCTPWFLGKREEWWTSSALVTAIEPGCPSRLCPCFTVTQLIHSYVSDQKVGTFPTRCPKEGTLLLSQIK